MSSLDSRGPTLRKLFNSIEEKFPCETVSSESWYLVTLAALIAGEEPERAAYLYTYLTEKPNYQSPNERKQLMRRLRECLFKLVIIIGIPKPLVALFSINNVTREEDKDQSFSKEEWHPGTSNAERGEAWLRRVYQADLGPIWNQFAAHQDFAWLEQQIVYGLFLSDHTILNGIETELVTLTGIMVQNLPAQTHWHLRGTRRIGVSQSDVEMIQQCIEMIAEYSEIKLDKVPRVADVEHEV